MRHEHMTPDERAEYDALMYEAGYDETGKPRPSAEIGTRILALLDDAADQAHREWAKSVREDLAASGALARWRKWNKTRTTIEVAGQTYVTTKAATIGIRRTDAAGRMFFQASFWDDLTRAELEQVIARSAKQIESEGSTIALARRLVALLDRVPEARTVADAARALGMTTSGYLAVVELPDDGAGEEAA